MPTSLAIVLKALLHAGRYVLYKGYMWDTMDYNNYGVFRRFSAVLLIHSGRCYEAEICVILSS